MDFSSLHEIIGIIISLQKVDKCGIKNLICAKRLC